MVDSGRKVFPWHRFLFLKIFVIKLLQRTASNVQACPPTACIILLDFLFDFFGICQGQLFVFSLRNCFATFTAFKQCHLSHLTCRLKSSRNKVHGFQRIIFAWGCHNTLQRIVIGNILRKVKMVCMQKNVSSLKLIKQNHNLWQCDSINYCPCSWLSSGMVPQIVVSPEASNVEAEICENLT